MRVFISHISEEAPLAHVLKDWIESSFAGQCDVFVSSDKDDIPAGSKWLEEIESALGSASALIVLCSPSSLSRPWISFETGCGWMKHVPIIPICHSGQKKASLPSPLSMLQALELDEQDFVYDLLSGLAKHLGFGKVPRIDQAAMRSQLTEAAGHAVADRTPPASEREPGNTQELLDEMGWRLGELVRVFGILREGRNRARSVTIQDYESLSDYIDKIFSGQTHFYKQYDNEKFLALAAKLANVKQAGVLRESISPLTDLEHSHRNKRDYDDIISQLERYRALLHA
jgi:hypothetical protein